MIPRPPALLLLALLAAAVLPAAPAAPAADVPLSASGVDLREEHAARRAALAAALPPGTLAVVPAVRADPSGLVAPRQDEDYAWLTGSLEADGVLLLWTSPGKGKPHGEILLLPPRNPRAEGWVGPRLFPGRAAEEALGVAATEDARKLAEAMKARLPGAKAVVLPRTGPGAGAAETLVGDLLREAKAATDDLRKYTGPLRLAKSAEEVARIRRASELTAEGHRRAMERAAPGMPEYAVQAMIEEPCRAGGCRRQAYDSIVGSGPNSCVLHYSTNRRVLERGDLVLVDAGGEYLGYATDVTRTWPVDAAFTEEQAKAYDAVLAAQAAGEAAAKPGATLAEVSAACAAVLKERGFGGAIRHGACHWVGLNVHDPNGAAAIVPGAVFTIEPGAYFEHLGWGIRIEDTYAVRADGTLDCLSAAAPKERRAVEALRAAAAGAAVPAAAPGPASPPPPAADPAPGGEAPGK